MDVMRPKILVIDGRQYRLNNNDDCPNDETRVDNTENLPSYFEKDDSEDEYDDLNIIMEGSQCVLKLEVPSVFYGLIIGKNRETLKNLEYQTKTRIKIPFPKEKKIITIKGEQLRHVISAKSKIDSIIKRGRSKQSMTHFISLPMVNQTVIDNYLAFKEMVLEKYSQCRGISEFIFIDPLKLHLTITCFVLCDAAEIKTACKLMEECEETIIKPMNLKSLDVLISGLDYMNDDPSEVNVLYAKVENPKIQELADNIQTFFEGCDLALQSRNDHVKLHVTLMNSRFYNNQNNVNVNSVKQSHCTFDAKQIIETFNDYTFGLVHLTDINLSQRHTIDSNGYYKTSFLIKLQ